MSGENIELVQLSKNNFIITMNKKALAAISAGKASGIKVNGGKGRKFMQFVFMRDTDFKDRMKQFNQMRMKEGEEEAGFFEKVKGFFL